mmetsp:Transcript_18252/g.58785  ORF Transcript_18252/g.58785 Transcript_18252/m.58785 type:complete len:617 (+) Transcript_18252:405-2255(+)
MSVVQAQTLPVILSGFDVIAKAKTGTGKTIAFLLPTIEVLLKPATGGGVRALAISPTRELASQIRDEAEQLITFHKPALTTAVVVGGTNIKSDVRMLQTKPPSLLVATPGRLNDLLYNYGADQACAGLMALIFDEADQLLEMGFRPDIQKILQALAPSRERRMTLLFSATLPKDVLSVAQIATRGPDRTKLVDTVGEETNTNAQVEQASTVTSLGGQAPELFALVQEATAEPGYKVVVFFTTARLTQLYSELFGASGVSVLEMHSRKSQPHRTRIADQFRDGTDLIMFSSDVSARGMDYPDVTAVIQVGMPSDRAQYIHRLGRTARAGKNGGGYLLLADFESFFLHDLRDLPLKKRPPLAAGVAASMMPSIADAFSKLPSVTLGCGYQAWLGFYNSYLKRLGWSKEEDNLILSSVAELGPKWMEIAARLPNRTDHAARNRYHRLLRLHEQSRTPYGLVGDDGGYGALPAPPPPVAYWPPEYQMVYAPQMGHPPMPGQLMVMHAPPPGYPAAHPAAPPPPPGDGGVVMPREGDAGSAPPPTYYVHEYAAAAAAAQQQQQQPPQPQLQPQPQPHTYIAAGGGYYAMAAAPSFQGYFPPPQPQPQQQPPPPQPQPVPPA